MTARLRRPALALLLWSALVLLPCSGTSPLYAFHDWTDANTYLTMGRGLLAGAVPYRDLFDHKGPLLYAVYALGAALDPGGFAGVFCLQCLSLALTLYGVYRLALCLGSEPVPALLCACALPLFLLSAGVYYLPDALDYGGGSAEEFCLPLFSLSLWLTVREEKPGGWALLALAALAGRLPAPRRPALAAGLLLPLLLLFTASANQMLLHKPLFCSSVPTCQETIAARIRSGPYRDPTVLEAGMLSRGFYNELGLIPPVRFFYLPNIPDALHPEILDSQLSAISRRAADYVILQSGDPDVSEGWLPEDLRQARLFRAAFQQYQLEAVIPGTGAVDHLFYYLFLRRPPLQTEPAARIAR